MDEEDIVRDLVEPAGDLHPALRYADEQLGREKRALRLAGDALIRFGERVRRACEPRGSIDQLARRVVQASRCANGRSIGTALPGGTRAKGRVDQPDASIKGALRAPEWTDP